MDVSTQDAHGQFFKALDSGEVVLVLGAGATIALTDGRKLDWTGLLDRMIENALQERALPAEMRERLREFSNALALRASAPDGLLSPSPAPVSSLLEIGTYLEKVYAQFDYLRVRFLDVTFATLDLKDDSDSKYFLETIAGFDCPILTVNYDDIIERHLGVRSVTLQNLATAARLLRDNIQSVIHLHGIYSDPASVVLGNHSYARLEENVNWTRFLDCLKNKKLVFIGFKTSMFDSAFTRFRRSAFAVGRDIDHWYWVLPDTERDELADVLEDQEHLPRIISFKRHSGVYHRDLSDFLNTRQRRLMVAPRRIPILSNPMSISLHNFGFTQSGKIDLLLNSGAWVREHLPQILNDRREHARPCKMRVILSAPTYENYNEYRQVTHDPPNRSYHEFVDRILRTIECLRNCRRDFGRMFDCEARFSDDYPLLRMSFFDDSLFITEYSKAPAVFLRGTVPNNTGTDSVSDGFERSLFWHYQKSFNSQWGRSISIDFDRAWPHSELQPVETEPALPALNSKGAVQ